ncbi:MAG: PCRF domain-containing protein [Candidatus Vogelbacteria bacterium]|nr:PCRF domain-containing protein [Candidatus Vogelbacteria bacterium]
MIRGKIKNGGIKGEITELERQMQAPDFWSDKMRAQAIIEEHKQLKALLAGGPAAEYDASDAVITIFSGAGGDDAEDWSRILYEMYLKFAARRQFPVFLIHQNENDHGGFRNITFEVRGQGSYGILKNESGVHRLVRISPFSAKKLRHTSFSLVEVIPKFEKNQAIMISPGDLKIEFSRASGPGGQNVNKRETAVRVVHLPTGLAAHAESERSQERNKERAIAILKGKLYKRQEAEREAKAAGLSLGKTTEIEWGSQIRSYVFHPYKLVKDHRTEVETSRVDEVLAGDLDNFIEAEKNLK